MAGLIQQRRDRHRDEDRRDPGQPEQDEPMRTYVRFLLCPVICHVNQ